VQHDEALAAVHAKSEAAQTEVVSLRQSLSSTDSAKNELELQLERAKSELNTALEEAGSTRRELAAARELHKRAGTESAQLLESRLREEQSQSARAAHEQLAQLRRELDSERHAREMDMVSLERDLESARADVATQRTKAIKADAARTDLEQRLEEARAELQLNNDRIDQLEGEVRVLRERSASPAGNGSSSVTAAELTAARTKIDELNRRLMQAQTHYDKMREALEGLGISIG
jgi:chromosome segregation ATPase